MATKNSSYWRIGFSALSVLALCQCRTAPHVETKPSPAQVVPQPPRTISPAPVVPSKQEPKKVAVILGPGGAKAMAHVGVLKAFEQQRIPIDKVVGLEWGALVGGLFAAKGQINDVEWKLYKMEQRGLPLPKGFFAKKLGDNSIKIMDEYFQDVFQREDVGSAKVPFECPSRSVWTGVVAWQNRGAFKDVMRRCLAFPPLFKAQGTFIAGASQAEEAIERLRGEGYNVIILVNVLGSAIPVDKESLLDNLDYVILWQEVRHALASASKLGVEVVNVDTSGVAMSQFESKKDLVTLGESVGQKAAVALVSKYGF